jgi:hypothetical protein
VAEEWVALAERMLNHELTALFGLTARVAAERKLKSLNAARNTTQVVDATPLLLVDKSGNFRSRNLRYCFAPASQDRSGRPLKRSVT